MTNKQVKQTKPVRIKEEPAVFGPCAYGCGRPWNLCYWKPCDKRKASVNSTTGGAR